MTKQITLNLPTLFMDNQDGGYTMYVFCDEEERLAHINEDKEENEVLTEEQLSGGDYDEYVRGYLGDTDIKLEVDMTTGKVKLAKYFSIHAGQ